METQAPTLMIFPQDKLVWEGRRIRFGEKLGITIPNDSDLEKALQSIIYGNDEKKKTWVNTLPVDIRKLILVKAENLQSHEELYYGITQKVIQFCYDNNANYSPMVISSLFAVVIINNALIWGQKDYCVYAPDDESAEKAKGIDGYCNLLEDQRWFYFLFSEPLETISQANFRSHDTYWHTSDLSVIATNAALKVFAELAMDQPMDQHERFKFKTHLNSVLHAKYYSVLYGKEGVNTPARKEYATMLFSNLKKGISVLAEE